MNRAVKKKKTRILFQNNVIIFSHSNFRRPSIRTRSVPRTTVNSATTPRMATVPLSRGWTTTTPTPRAINHHRARERISSAATVAHPRVVPWTLPWAPRSSEPSLPNAKSTTRRRRVWDSRINSTSCRSFKWELFYFRSLVFLRLESLSIKFISSA